MKSDVDEKIDYERITLCLLLSVCDTFQSGYNSSSCEITTQVLPGAYNDFNVQLKMEWSQDSAYEIVSALTGIFAIALLTECSVGLVNSLGQTFPPDFPKMLV